MSAAKKVMASVAQDLVDEALQDELAQVDHTRMCPSLWFDLAPPTRLHIQLFTAACSSAFIREVALVHTALGVLRVFCSSNRALIGSVSFACLFLTGWVEASQVRLLLTSLQGAYFNCVSVVHVRC